MNNQYLKALSPLVSLSLIMAVAGCSLSERSRNLNDARISPVTTALQVCSNCHGVQGVSTSPLYPNLAAQSKPYMIKQLAAFRSHQRSDPQGYEYMWGLSAHLTDDQINGLATYFSQLPPPRGSMDNYGTPDMLQKGQSIFEQGITASGVPACASCHGDHAQGSDDFPRLAGQHADYVMKQLKVFQLTENRPDGVAMKAVTHSLTSDDMANVAAYLERMPPG